jgi:lysosomal alpha-mannosidase
MQTFANWITQTVRVYTGQPYVDIEWIVGPVPIDDDNVRGMWVLAVPR